MSRKTARENAFKLIFGFCVTGSSNDFSREMVVGNSDKPDGEFTDSVYIGVVDNIEFLSGVIKRYSIDFSYERIYKVDLAIMLISAYEILLRTDIPIEVSVNEAVELAKIYSTEKSAVYINGLLASVVKNKEELISEREDN